MPRPLPAIALAAALGATAAQAQQLAPQEALLARNLAATCANCHGTNGQARGDMKVLAGVSAGKITERERDRALDGLSFTTDLADLADRQLVVEAVIEDDAVKAKIFAELDALITDPDAVLASNTSSIPIMKIAAATKNPSRVIGLHFFNPVPVLPLVELDEVGKPGDPAPGVQAYCYRLCLTTAADRLPITPPAALTSFVASSRPQRTCWPMPA